jgi:hypothetical protein
MTATRRLTAILAADVAGYSRQMGADEEGTQERLKAHLRLGRPLIVMARHWSTSLSIMTGSRRSSRQAWQHPPTCRPLISDRVMSGRPSSTCTRISTRVKL